MSKQDVEQDIMLVTLAIREILMGYFKGFAGSDIAGHSAVTFHHSDRGRGQHQYERELAQLRNQALIFIGDAMVMDIGKGPNTAVINPVMGRSPEFRAIKVNIIKFFQDYLPNVSFHVTEAEQEEVSDKELIRNNNERMPMMVNHRTGWETITSSRVLTMDEITTFYEEVSPILRQDLPF